MTNMDLLYAIGQAEDKYIAEAGGASSARRLRVKRCVPAVTAGVAAVLMVCIFASRAGTGTPGEIPDETFLPSGAEAFESLPGEDSLENRTPQSPTYPEGDYYYISYRASNQEVEIDFPSLFDALTENPGVSDYTPENLIAANPAAYDELMSHGEETLFYCLCLSARNLNLIGKDQCDAKTALAVHIVKDMTRDDEYVSRFLADGDSDSNNFNMLWRIILSDYLRYGNEWLAEVSPNVYQFVRAVVSVPDLRLSTMKCDGETYHDVAAFHATLAFAYVLDRADTESSRKLANDTLPEPPEDVCNEYTAWSMTQAEDGTVTLTFTNVTDGSFKGALTYFPTEDEMILVPDSDGNMAEDLRAPVAGYVKVTYANTL